MIFRVLLLFGLSGPGSSPLVADYVKNRSRGTASAYVGLNAGLGVLSGMFILFGLTKELTYTVSYGIVGAITFILGLFLLFTVKNANFEKKGVKDLNFRDKV